MEFLKKNLRQIQEHLGNLSRSQQLLFAVILGVMGIAVYLLVTQTAQPELIPLVDQSLTDPQIARIQNQLDLWNAFYRVENGRIMVKRQEQNRLFARLQMNRALPQDLSESWRKLIMEENLWLSPEDKQKRWQMAKDERLGQIIRSMDGVEEAQVIINAGSKRLLSDGPSSDPSASVIMTMEGSSKPDKRLVQAVADMVAGAEDRLSRDRVNIIINGASYKAQAEGSPFTGDVLEVRQAYERDFAAKIQQTLGIDKVLVGVFVELETDTVKTEMKKFSGDPQVIREHATEDTAEEKTPGGEPGVRPNVGTAVAAPESAGQKSSKTEKETVFSEERDLTHTIKQNHPGTVKSVRATVNVPRSYFIRLYEQQGGKSAKPTDAELQPIVDGQLKTIHKQVLPIINAADPTFVEVSQYYDQMPVEAKTALASSDPISRFGLTEYARPAGLAVLAFGSLLMVLMMLRKASANVGIPNLEIGAKSPEPVSPLDAEVGPVGEASSTEGVLQGIEVDEDTLRTRKMAEQVATMVKEDPVGAAALVRQWIIKDR